VDTKEKIFFIYTSKHTGAVASVYSHFLIFKKFKINNKYIIFKIVVKKKYIKIKFK